MFLKTPKKSRSTSWSNISIHVKQYLTYRHSNTSQLRFWRFLPNGPRKNYKSGDSVLWILPAAILGIEHGNLERTALWPESVLSCSGPRTSSVPAEEGFTFVLWFFKQPWDYNLAWGTRLQCTCFALTCQFYGTQDFWFECCSLKHSLSHGFKCLAQDSPKSSLL